MIIFINTVRNQSAKIKSLKHTITINIKIKQKNNNKRHQNHNSQIKV